MGTVFFVACGSSSVESTNPYDNQPELDEHDRVNTDTVELEEGSLPWLQEYVFTPTCANSGCHDGLFEPDFRTASSTYNTLVNRVPIKQDELDPLPARVVPGSADRSMLVRRLEEDLNGNSGIMPLLVDQGNDWTDKKDFYIEKIRAWIDNGAPDENGNTADNLDLPPQFVGFAAYINGTQRPRTNEKTPILVPAGTKNLEIRFAYNDDKTQPTQFDLAQYAFTQDVTQFDSIQWVDMNVDNGGVTYVGYYGDDVVSYLRAIVDVSMYPSGEVLWFRSKVSDGENEKELPSENSLFNLRMNATIRIQ